MKPLAEYARKRNFRRTAEPGAEAKKPGGKKKRRLIFVVQEHHASHLHYDFRLEWGGVLKSWAVPKGPSLDPKQKRLAVEVEDHPVAYAEFTGEIPKGEYGGGTVYRWDIGEWIPGTDPDEGLKKGSLEFTLKGGKLGGGWRLVRTRRGTGPRAQWLLMKRNDDFAVSGDELTPVGKSGAHGPATAARGGKKKSKATRTSKALSSKDDDSDGEVAGKPDFVDPQLARLVDRAPAGPDWVHEIKFDGYRIQAHVVKGRVTLFTRNGHDWTKKYPALQKSLKKLKVTDAVIDGEVCWQDEAGRSDFQTLQNVMKDGGTNDLVYWAFDLLHLDGKDLRSLPLIARKDRLRKMLKAAPAPRVLYSDHFREDGPHLLRATCQMKLEGIISKRVDGTYVSGRHDAWVKSKCGKRQEFVVAGFSEADGSRLGFGALLLGVYEGKQLRYAGRVGTGFNQKTLLDLGKKLRALEVDESPFDLASPRGRTLHWIKPKLVCEVSFAEWTREGSLRAPVFQGLRADKDPKVIVAEREAEVEGDHVAAGSVGAKVAKSPKASGRSPKSNAPTKSAVKTGGVPKITHPDRIIYKDEGLTKLDVALYYQYVAPLMVPHLADRPLSLLRCTSDAKKPCFYAKHFPDKMPEPLIPIPQRGKAPFFALDSAEGIAALVQYGTLEFHPWNCHRDDLERPDQIVMDFDPDPTVSFAAVKDGAFELRALLKQLGIESFVKVTGGKGVHVQFPYAPRYEWDVIKNFTKTLVAEMSSRRPDVYTANVAKKARAGKIFVDYLRNGRGATAVAPYSLRARDDSAVAMPISWAELKTLNAGNTFDLKTALAYLKKRRKDPWAGYLSLTQSIKMLHAKG